MPRGRPKSDKNPFDDLPEEFRNKVNSLDRHGLEHEMAVVAGNQVELMKAKKEDGDLAECRERLKCANDPYSSGSKQNKLKLTLLKQLLDDKGGPTASR